MGTKYDKSKRVGVSQKRHTYGYRYTCMPYPVLKADRNNMWEQNGINQSAWEYDKTYIHMVIGAL